MLEIQKRNEGEQFPLRQLVGKKGERENTYTV